MAEFNTRHFVNNPNWKYSLAADLEEKLLEMEHSIVVNNYSDWRKQIEWMKENNVLPKPNVYSNLTSMGWKPQYRD